MQLVRLGRLKAIVRSAATFVGGIVSFYTRITATGDTRITASGDVRITSP